MQALKALVILMAVLIVAGMALLVYGLVTRTGGPDKDGGVTSLDLAVPEGCRIAASALEAERLVLRLDGFDGLDCQQVLVVDLAGGRLIARVRAVPGAVPPAGQ